MIVRALPDAEFLRECLEYSPETGVLTWRERPTSHFRNDTDGINKRAMAVWNSRYAGTVAFGCKMPGYGYFTGRLGGKNYLAHRLIWKLYYGVDPNRIDHINGDPSDNRLNNLRSVTSTLNNRNRSPRKDSATGIVGVYLVRKTGNFQSTIRVNGRPRYLGTFSKIEEAASAREVAERRYGYISRPSTNRKGN
jgi:hypothetical protein